MVLVRQPVDPCKTGWEVSVVVNEEAGKIRSHKDSTPPERLISGESQQDDDSPDLSLRPRRLSDFVGQTSIKDNLSIAIQAAKLRGESLDHVIIYSPPGLGRGARPCAPTESPWASLRSEPRLTGGIGVPTSLTLF